MQEPILELAGISMAFGRTQALRGMSLRLLPGEVHAVVGENGAGKSTMIKIMTGVHQPTEGRMLLNGHAKHIPDPQAAREAGIAAIYQEPMVFPDLSVAENILISVGDEGVWLSPARQRQRAGGLISRIGVALDPDQMASGLTLAEQQTVEIARALCQDIRILIMDEPTASLSAHEAERLRGIAKALASEGVAVVYISHRLEEIFDVADRVTVIRDGSHISTKPIAEVTSESMIAEMVGREVGNYLAKCPSTAADEVILDVRDLTLKGVFENISFDLRKGEILCMSGLVGARRTDVALAIFGAVPATGGAIRYKGEDVAIASPRQAIDAGIAYVSEDRRKFGLAMPMPIRSNISLATLAEFRTPWGLLRRGREAEAAERFRKKLSVRTPNVELAAGMLSGGNQQKVMLAKWLNMNPDLLIFDEPTRGIDVRAKAEVHGLIRKFAAAGGAVLVISSDLPEVLALGDRILVMREGAQMGILSSDEASQEKIMSLATGRSELQEAC